MRPVRALLIYAGAVFLGGALLAPWLYWSLQLLAGHVPALQKLAHHPFHRHLHRSFLALALIGLPPLLGSLGLRAPGDIGLVRATGHWRKLARGFALGFVSLAAVAALGLAAGARELNPEISTGRLVETVSGAALTAAVVAVLEEVLFRGALFGGLRQRYRWPAALVISSAIYALVHFFSKTQSPDEIQWTSGLILLPMMLRGFADVEQVVPGFFNLTLAGALLALAFQRTGNLYFSIGLHAGWIFWLRSYGFLTRETPDSNTWFWGTNRLIDGWLALVVLGGVLFIFWQRFPRREASAPASAK